MLSFKIAFRFLSTNKAQTALIIIGIAIGVSVQIFIGSLITSLQESLIDKTIGSSSHITISSKTKNELIDNRNIINKEIKFLSSSLDYNAYIDNSKNTYPILLRGFDIKKANKIYKFDKNLIGRMPLNNNEIILGINLKNDASIKLNSEVKIISLNQKETIVKVVGFYDLKVSSVNTLWVISNQETVRDISNIENSITSIEMQVYDIFKADKIANKIQINNNEKITNWKTENESLLSGLNGQSISSIMIQVFVLISVILGIVSVLIISVVQKSKQIGILKAIGIKDKDASKIFLFEGAMLGIMGALLGVIFGLLLGLSFATFALNPDKTPVIPLNIEPLFIFISFMIAVIASVLASLVPSIKSSKLSPMEVIKNG